MCLPVKEKGRGVDLTGEATDSVTLSSGLQDLEVSDGRQLGPGPNIMLCGGGPVFTSDIEVSPVVAQNGSCNTQPEPS